MAQNSTVEIHDFDYQRDFKRILERTKNKHDTIYYLKLLTRFQKNDTTLTRAEILSLMIGYTDSRFYRPYEDMMAEKEIIKLNDKGLHREAIHESGKYLKLHPLSLSVNKERSYAYFRIKNRDSARYYMDMADMIMEAMIHSGKGKSPERAFFSLGLIDGDYFIPNVGLTIFSNKTGKDKFRNLLYIVDAVSLEDIHTSYYFNIQHAKRKMEQDEAEERMAELRSPKKTRGNKKSSSQPEVKQFMENPADCILPDAQVLKMMQLADSIENAKKDSLSAIIQMETESGQKATGSDEKTETGTANESTNDAPPARKSED
jgi:hypothetical protein